MKNTGLSASILFFFLAMVFWGVTEPRLSIFPGFEFFEIPLPAWSYRALAVVLLAMSAILLIGTIWRSLEGWLSKLLEEPPGTPWVGLIQFTYFMLFWTAFLVGWLKGVSAISEPLFFHAAFWGGLVLFLAIPGLWFKTMFVYWRRRQS